MPDQLPQTITCPVCANVNPWSQDFCLRDECHLDLRPIKQQIMGSAPAGNPPAPPPPTQPSEPAPPLPELSERGKDEPIGELEASRRFLIPGLGDRADEIAARFFRRVGERGIDGVKPSVGKLVIKLEGERTDSRDYYFVERDLGEGALATMAVRIAPNGTDLFVEWRHFSTPSWTKYAYYYFCAYVPLCTFMVAFIIGFLNYIHMIELKWYTVEVFKLVISLSIIAGMILDIKIGTAVCLKVGPR